MASRAKRVLVTFWGTRGSISTPGSKTEKYGGNTVCVSVSYGKTMVIIDAGTGIRNLGLELAQKARQNNRNLNLHLLLSHTHWDHIQGLPFFTPAYLKGTKLKIYGSPKKESFLEAILSRQMDVNYFPVEMTQLAADISITELDKSPFKIGPVTVDWQEQHLHPGGCVRFRLRMGDKRIIYASDVELDEVFACGNKTRKNAELRKQYCEFIKNADLLIADGQYTEEQYEYREGYGHTSVPVLMDIAHKQRVKQLAVFHHEPQNSDVVLDGLWSKYCNDYCDRKPPMNVFWAREGMTVAI